MGLLRSALIKDITNIEIRKELFICISKNTFQNELMLCNLTLFHFFQYCEHIPIEDAGKYFSFLSEKKNKKLTDVFMKKKTFFDMTILLMGSSKFKTDNM